MKIVGIKQTQAPYKGRITMDHALASAINALIADLHDYIDAPSSANDANHTKGDHLAKGLPEARHAFLKA
jgi:hypothetical protein